MASKFLYLFLVLFVSRVESASLLEKSYDYVVNLGKSIAPNFLSMIDCLGEDEFWSCAKEKAGKMFDSWDKENEQERKLWQEAADSEVMSSGRAIQEMPSKLGKEIEDSLVSVADLVQQGMARAFSRGHHEGGGEATITISTASDKKKKNKKKKKKPSIHVVGPMVKDSDRGFGTIQSWVIGGKSIDHSNISHLPGDGSSSNNRGSSSNSPGSSVKSDESSDIESNVHDSNLNRGIVRGGVRKGRGIISDFWDMGQQAVDAVAEHAVESDLKEDGLTDKSSFEEQRGKKKKKKKAILKLLILGAVLKAKIATLLQILSFKLQVKFFLVALIGLAINLARFWLDLKKQHAPPQKVIYYEHAQHQHHYEHEDEHGWGPWSRSMEPEDSDTEVDVTNHSPYRAVVDRNIQLPYQAYKRPLLSRV